MDGEHRDLEVVAMPLFSSPDRLEGGLAVFWDRTPGS
jgi:hypothetical protein